jgi:CarD family transcriptional regulator
MPLGDMKVMIPADKAENIGLRDVIPEARVDEVRDVLEDEPERLMGTWNRRYHTNLERLKSGDICDAAAVTRNLVVQERERRISAGERRLLDLARQIVVSELVYACDKSPAEVEVWMDDILAANNS